MGKSVEDWYKKNAKGNPYKIASFAGNVLYDETMKKLPISLPEDVAVKMYAAKFYGKRGWTELTSSFFEYMSEDANALLTKHPSFCNLIIKTLKDKQ